MREKYMKPEIRTDEFAQFENVYTGGCDKNPGWINNGNNPNCAWSVDFAPDMGFDYDAHVAIRSNPS